jgi:hypothetical protein
MNPSNPFLRATILSGKTVQRLRQQGISLDDAKKWVVQVINSEEAEMHRQRRAFDEAQMAERLKRLPEFLS